MAVGTHVKTSDSTIVEFFALAGFDFVWIDGEHPAMNIETAQRHVAAAQGAGAAAFYRVPWNDPVLAKPALDMGADGIIFPMVRTRAEAERAVAACRYPPRGARGWGPIRDNGYGLFSSEWQLANAEDFWVILQIEHFEAVDNLESILDAEGVSALTVGAGDLSASLGVPGQIRHPEVLRHMEKIARLARERGVPFSISCGNDPEFVRWWIERGINWLSVGGEYDFMKAGLSAALENARAACAHRGA